MRRLALAAVCATLVVAACSDQDQSPTEPSVPPPSATFGTTCDHGRYPLRSVALLIPAAFPTTLPGFRALRAEALVRVGAIALLWDFCKDQLARQAALKTIAWIDTKVTSTQADALKDAILDGFGAGALNGDFVTGLFVPGTTQRFTTSDFDATLELQGDAFPIPTLITIRRLANNFTLSDFDGEQRPPFYDYDATNSATNNTAASHAPKPGSAVMAFCYEPVGQEYPDDGASIGHNPVGGGFELVPEVPVPPALQEELSACPPFIPEGLRLGSLGSGLPGFGRHLSSMAQKLFLPAPLYAATVGGRGPIAGSPPSLSPFGLVLVSLNQVTIVTGTDPGDIDGSYDVGETLDNCNEGCTPEFFIDEPGEGGTIETPTQVTVTLVPEGESNGTLNGTRVKMTSATSPFTADFNDLSVTAPGTYHLVASAAGATFYVTGSFTVEAAPPPIP